jgi:hypothetical protein
MLAPCCVVNVGANWTIEAPIQDQVGIKSTDNIPCSGAAEQNQTGFLLRFTYLRPDPPNIISMFETDGEVFGISKTTGNAWEKTIANPPDADWHIDTDPVWHRHQIYLKTGENYATESAGVQFQITE